MKKYLIQLTDNMAVIVECKSVKIKIDGTAVFYSERESLVENNLYGPHIHAAFQPGQYKYFTEDK